MLSFRPKGGICFSPAAARNRVAHLCRAFCDKGGIRSPRPHPPPRAVGRHNQNHQPRRGVAIIAQRFSAGSAAVLIKSRRDGRTPPLRSMVCEARCARPQPDLAVTFLVPHSSAQNTDEWATRRQNHQPRRGVAIIAQRFSAGSAAALIKSRRDGRTSCPQRAWCVKLNAPAPLRDPAVTFFPRTPFIRTERG